MSEINLNGREKEEVAPASPLDGAGVAPERAWFEQPANEHPFERHVLTTPLHLVSASHSRTNQWAEWNGYTLANVYTTIEQEYDALRTRAALSDISPLVKYRISGKEAGLYLDRLLTRSTAGVGMNHVVRALLCAGDGGIVTQGLLFRLGESDFRLVVRSHHLDWLLDAADGFEVCVEDVSGTIAAMSLAGPSAKAVLLAAGVKPADTLEKMQAIWCEPGGMPVYVSRTGMTGGLEYELWVDPDDAPIVWRRLLEAGRSVGILPVGLSVRNIARLENGVPLEGIDYHGAFDVPDPSFAGSPFALGQGHMVDLERTIFNGQKALSEIARRGSPTAMRGIEINVPQGTRASILRIGDRQVGQITSQAWSPVLQLYVALVTVEAGVLDLSDGLTVDVDQEGEGHQRVPVVLRKRAFLQFP